MDQALINEGWRPPTLTTARLTLRSLTPADAPAMFEHARNPNVTRYTLWDAHPSVDVTRQFLEGYTRDQYLQAIPEPIGVFREGAFIGCVGARWMDRKSMCMDVGYWIAEPYWGQGYTVEACRALIDFVFANYTVERVQAHCMAENTTSARVLEKLGLQYEGTFRSALYHRGRFWDLKWYAVLRGEWRPAGR